MHLFLRPLQKTQPLYRILIINFSHLLKIYHIYISNLIFWLQQALLGFQCTHETGNRDPFPARFWREMQCPDFDFEIYK